jgi:hypothetical protein
MITIILCKYGVHIERNIPDEMLYETGSAVSL